MRSFTIQLVKAENGFWMEVGPGPEDIVPEDVKGGRVKYYIAKNDQEVAEIIRKVAGELKE